MKRNACARRLAALMFAGSFILTAAQAQALTLITLHPFAGSPDGSEPFANLISDAAGNLYGTTTRGGTNNFGTVFKLTANAGGSYTETVLYSFTGGADGSVPYSALISDAAGNLYGTTTGDISAGNGNIFMLSPSATTPWPITVLYNFAGGTDGSRPLAALVADPSGNLYGTTFQGGASFSGTVFMLTRSASAPWPKTLLFSFAGGAAGGLPQEPLILDAAGNLYGTLTSGGASSAGLVFMLTRSAAAPWPETVLYSFAGGADGAAPNGPIADASGNLYGTTIGGGIGCGVGGCGTVFMLTRSATAPWTKTLLYTFSGAADGGTPESGVVMDSAGNLYGTTTGGGYQGGGGISPSGVVYKLTAAANAPWPQTVLYTFTGQTDGGYPYGGLLIDTAGNVYGTTVAGGTSNNGTAFELTSAPATCTDNAGGIVQIGGKQFVPCPAGEVGTSACPPISPVVGPGLPNCGTEICIAQNTWSSPDFSLCTQSVAPTCLDNSGVTVPLGGKQFVPCPAGQVGTAACPSVSPVIGPGLPNCGTEICVAQNTWSSPPDFGKCDAACTDNGSIFPVGTTETENCTGGQSGTQSRTCNAGGNWGPWNTSACVCPTGELLCLNTSTLAKQCVIPLPGITDTSGAFHAWCGNILNDNIDCSTSCPAGVPCGPAFDNAHHIQTTDMYCGDGSIGPRTGGGSDVALVTFLALMAVWSVAGLWHRRRRALR